MKRGSGMHRHMAASEVYLFGQITLSTIHKLAGRFPEADGYGEIERSFLCPGGQVMNAAMVLSGLGLKTAIGGPNWGTETAEVLDRYSARYGIDTGGIVRDPGYAGLRDIVFVDGTRRTVFGRFRALYSEKQHRWCEPDEAAIRAAGVVAIDPYFGSSSEAAAHFASEAGVPYVTIDCPHDGYLHRNAAATVVSGEYWRPNYAGQTAGDVIATYAEQAAGLTIFTAGSDQILCARRGKPVFAVEPYRVEAISTLGAGDTFRAGVVFGVLKGWGDEKVVRFAAALAAILCTRLPIADNVPTLAEVSSLMERGPVAKNANCLGAIAL
jgi:sugar/nucleoside kinase (ribokinase family)